MRRRNMHKAVRLFLLTILNMPGKQPGVVEFVLVSYAPSDVLIVTGYFYANVLGL